MKNKLKKQEKWFWEKEFGFKAGDLDKIDPVADRLNYRDCDTTDDDLYWLSTRIQVIRQLDLDNTLITDEGIAYIAKIHIQELRLKGCNVTAKCISALNKIETLSLLHLGSTAVTLDDLTGLKDLRCLKMVLVNSENSVLTIRKKVNKLRLIHPECEFIVNRRSYEGPKLKLVDIQN